MLVEGIIRYMELIRLSSDNAAIISQKKIICYMCVPQYLKEISKQYCFFDQIEFIVDDFPRRQKDILFEGRLIKVTSPEVLKNIDFSNYALLITSEYYFEVFEKIRNDSELSTRINEVYYFVDLDTRYYLEYNELFSNCGLEDILVFRSGDRTNKETPWKDFDDNARALFDYMISKKKYEKYKFVWLVDNPDYFADISKDIGDKVIFVSYNDSTSSDKEKRYRYYYYLCLAKYIFFTNNASFARLTRKDQIRIQLWHGQGFKSRGIDVSLRRRCEIMPVMSHIYKNIHKKIFDLSDEQIVITGIPKQDWVNEVIDIRLLQVLGIPKAEKYIFWLPTVRKMVSNLSAIDSDILFSETGLSIIETMDELVRINSILKTNDTVLVIKPHPSQDESRYAKIELSNVYFLSNTVLGKNFLHINKLMYAADALISDYSSVAVDYLLLDRPIGFAVGDIEDYKDDRGFVFEPIEDWLPGKIIKDYMQFEQFISEVSCGIDSGKDTREKVSKELVIWRDTDNCRRLLEHIGL